MPFAVRLKVPQDRGIIAWDDMVKGHIEINSSELDDFILVRSDGTPTYNFAVVIDDHTMGVTHVLRGEDHIPTPLSKSLFMKHWAGKHRVWTCPMILGKDKPNFPRGTVPWAWKHIATKGSYLKRYLTSSLCWVRPMTQTEKSTLNKNSLSFSTQKDWLAPSGI